MFRTRMEQHSPEQPGPYDVTAKVAITQPVQNDHRTESWTSGRSARNRRSAFSFDRFEGAHLLNAQERTSRPLRPVETAGRSVR
jgi:hypothetical protein